MHNFLLRVLLMLFGLLIAGDLNAADAPPEGAQQETNSENECARVKNLEPPKADRPSKALLDSVAGCDAEALYYEAAHDPKASQQDWNKVRACASATSDDRVMMMLYANGYGVKRNYDLAIKYACGMEGDSALEVIVGDLAELNSSGKKPVGSFDVCTYAAVPMEQGVCLSRNHDYEGKSRERQLDELGGRLNPAQKGLLAKLRQAMLAYSSARGNEETDQSGSNRYTSSVLGEEATEAQFMEEISQLEKGNFPAYTQQQFESLDKELNEKYRYILRNMVEEKETPSGFPPISKAGIRSTERIWLKYLDAWVAFGRARYPSVPDYAWKAMLTKWRIADLEDLKNELGMNN